jgi:hypothetical protein
MLRPDTCDRGQVEQVLPSRLRPPLSALHSITCKCAGTGPSVHPTAQTVIAAAVRGRMRIRTATPLLPTLWASLPGLMIFNNPELDRHIRTLSWQKMITTRLCSARSERSAVPVLDSGQVRNVEP